jgi:nucleoside-diphosphate-sugar epimerase
MLDLVPSSLPLDSAEADLFLSRPDAAVCAVVAALPPSVVVLGAGGKMGLHLCLMLRLAACAIGRELRVVAISRFQSLRDQESFTAAGIETWPADLSNEAEVARLPDASTVFFLAGAKFGTSASPDLLEQMNVRVPSLVAKRYRRSRIVAFSTGCVYPFVDARSGGATESLSPGPVGKYAESCLAREKVFTELALKENTKVALIRLNYAIEFRYGVLLDIATKVLGGKPIDVTTGYVNVIWQRDAVAHIIQTISIAANPAVPINVTGKDTLSVRTLAERFGVLFDTVPVISGSEAPAAWLSNAGWSHRLFGEPAADVETMLQLVAAWLVRGSPTWGKPTGFERRDGKF